MTDRRLEQGEEHPITIIGMALRVPGAVTPQQFWHNVLEGRDSITHFAAQELRRAGIPTKKLSNPDYVPTRPVLEDIEHFDAALFGISELEAERSDPSH